ncbi:MAG: hypothetical protein RBT87_04595 [bacterium]|jgi:hypothetical protein|nr:hypothetical protein [bacterium]
MREKKSEKSTEKKKETKGLCDNCVNHDFCSYAKTTDKPVMFCEEYDFYNKLIEKYGIDLSKEKKEKKK